MPLDVSKAPATASPLWIIALFIALSEATAGVAAITTNGSTRLIFACFAVSFPVAVFVVFVWLLIRHAPNLYAPGQYSSDITPEIYRTGIGVGISQAQSLFFARAVAETVVPPPGEHSGGEDRDAVVAQVAQRFEAAVAESSVTVSLARLKPGAERLQIPVTEGTRVDSLLDAIYFALEPAVKPFTYEQTWVLIDERGTEYSDMGTEWARRRNLPRDSRPIADVGIVPGSQLTAVAKGIAARRHAFFRGQTDGLVNELRAKLRSDGVEVEDVDVRQRPRLLAREGDEAYGLYVIPGRPGANDDWVGLAKAASERLEADRGLTITPVLALDSQPTVHLQKMAAASHVIVIWLQNGVLHRAPWMSPNEDAEALR